jgi:type II secretory pathway pseudopilin PulG
MKQKGLTLIEMVTIIVILGLTIPVLLTMWADVSWRSARSEQLADSSFYAQQLMEEVKSKSFDNNTDQPWTNSSSFGVDAGENRANRATFNDVDDFVGATDANITTPVSGFTRSVAIDYVKLPVNNTWTGCGATVCNTTTDCTLCAACCYKRIRVSTISNIANAGNATLVTIMSSN